MCWKLEDVQRSVECLHFALWNMSVLSLRILLLLSVKSRMLHNVLSFSVGIYLTSLQKVTFCEDVLRMVVLEE